MRCGLGIASWLVSTTESLILAQNERWRRGLGMQVERSLSSEGDSGKRVSNTWVIYLKVRNNFGKLELIPDVIISTQVQIIKGGDRKACRFLMSPRPISLLVR